MTLVGKIKQLYFSNYHFVARMILQGPALMAVWSKALPPTASSLTTVPVRIPFGECEKDVRDLGLGSGFCRVHRFTPPVTTG